MCEIINFTKSLPNFDAPKDAEVVLIFDASFSGLRDALKWHADNPNREAYRVIIPYSDPHQSDVGDYLCAEKKGIVLGTANAFPSDHKFHVRKMSNDVETIEWPYPSKNRWCDLEKAYMHLRSQLFLRDAATGFNALQTYMLANLALGEDEVKAACSAHFKIPIVDVKVEFAKLKQGNIPALTKIEHELPHVFINGPYPMDPKAVAAGIEQSVNFGTSIEWDKMEPSCPLYMFTQSNVTGKWMSRCTKNQTGEIIGLPYGKHPETVKNFTVVNRAHEPDRFHGTDFSVVIEWDPMFLQGELTPCQYFKFWLSACIKRMDSIRCDALDQMDRKELRYNLLKSIVLEAKNVKFLDESMDQKRMRIARDFENDQSLLDTPIRFLDREHILFGDDDEEIPESWHEYLIAKLKPHL